MWKMYDTGMVEREIVSDSIKTKMTIAKIPTSVLYWGWNQYFYLSHRLLRNIFSWFHHVD